MKSKTFAILLVSFCLLVSIFSIGYAWGANVIKVVTDFEYVNSIENYEATVSSPYLEGLADPNEQDKLNDYFSQTSETIVKNFESEAKSVAESKINPSPHYFVEHAYDVLADSSEYFSFRVYTYTAAGSSNYSAEAYTIDKMTGKLLTLEDFFGTQNYREAIRNYIRNEMTAQNQAGETSYWLDDSFDQSIDALETLHHFYVNEQGQLVVFFNKYEVGPGVMGTPQFVLPADVLSL